MELLFGSEITADSLNDDSLGRFLATNVLSKESMTDEQMLFEYKEQSSVEGGFKFIKNDAIGLDDVYLKKPGTHCCINGNYDIMPIGLWHHSTTTTHCIEDK